MRHVFLLLLLICATLLRAQVRCTVSPVTGNHAVVTGIAGFPVAADDRLTDILPAASSIIRIPVVVHVVYQNGAQNISDAQVISGIEALNRDMRRRNADTVHTPASFRQLAADMQIEFVLACTDPWGRATKGIVRKATTVKEWIADDKIKFSAKGGSDAWDTRSYLNIWVGNMPRSLGYGTSPGGNSSSDGIVITTSAFGTLGRSGAYNMGRTLVHEVGHWLGLKHIWGDESCGDDGIGDTPRQAGFTSGCPSGVISTCSNGTNGDMYMNYMDFTNDACMNLFTKGQKERARALFAKGGARASLLSGKGLAAVPEAMPTTGSDTVVQTKAVRSLNLYPNPANDWLVVEGPKNTTGKLHVHNLFGFRVYTCAYNGTALRIATNAWPPGMYQVELVMGNETIRSKVVRTSVQ